MCRFVTDTAASADAPGVYHVTFDSSNWDVPVLVTVHARNISTPQDPHDTPIIQSIDASATTDPAYLGIVATGNQRLDATVISDQTPGLFQQQPPARRSCRPAQLRPAPAPAPATPCG